MPSKFAGVPAKFGGAPAKSCCCGGGGGEAIKFDPGTKVAGGAFVTNPGVSAAATKSGAAMKVSAEPEAATPLNEALSLFPIDPDFADEEDWVNTGDRNCAFCCRLRWSRLLSKRVLKSIT